MSRHARVNPLDRDAAARADATVPSAGVAVVSREAAAEALLDTARRQVLEQLQTPGSASSVAAALKLPRQRVNYHVRALERAGLVEQVATRPRRGLTERIVRATAACYVISPDALGRMGNAELQSTDRFSATFQVAVAARTVREVASLAELARDAGKPLTTLTLDATIRFATPASRQAFANDLVDAVNALVAKYHDERAGDGRTYRFFAGSHPIFERTLS
jgi:DNA-binding transcriptional ArsR family regulator